MTAAWPASEVTAQGHGSLGLTGVVAAAVTATAARESPAAATGRAQASSNGASRASATACGSPIPPARS